MKLASPFNDELLGIERLVALIDGVFAVAITLLVLDLRLSPEKQDLPHALQQMAPSLVIYLIVFASVAGYWTIHHRTFRTIAHADGRLILLSLLNLLFVTLYPVSASILGSYPSHPLAAALLSLNSLFYCLSAWAVWSHAASHPFLLKESSDPGSITRVARIMLLVAIGLVLAIPLAFLSVYFAYAIWMIWPPLSAMWVGGQRRAIPQ